MVNEKPDILYCAFVTSSSIPLKLDNLPPNEGKSQLSEIMTVYHSKYFGLFSPKVNGVFL